MEPLGVSMRTLSDSQLEELFEVAVDRCGAEVNFADDFRSTTRPLRVRGRPHRDSSSQLVRDASHLGDDLEEEVSTEPLLRQAQEDARHTDTSTRAAIASLIQAIRQLEESLEELRGQD